jgi:hypothetical protein
MERACLSPLRGWRPFFNRSRGCVLALLALAPGYLLAAPSALRHQISDEGAFARVPRLRHSNRRRATRVAKLLVESVPENATTLVCRLFLGRRRRLSRDR